MAVLNDYDLAGLCNALYRPPWPKGYWNHIWSDAACFCAHKVSDDTDVIIFRGSDDVLDWLNDFDAAPFVDPVLGMVHCGFWKPVSVMLPQLDAVLTQPKTIIIGHSLGAARACLYGAHLTVKGHTPVEIVVWGCPKPGFQKLADILAPVPLRSYKNLNDPVTTVPDYIAEIGQLYVEPRPFIPISVQPPLLDMWEILAPHHFWEYLAGMAHIFGVST